MSRGIHMDAVRPTRRTRSKRGCLTCRRRRVRCNEAHPRCNHCERLHLKCTWRPTHEPSDLEDTSDVAIPVLDQDVLSTTVPDSTYDAIDNWDFNDIVWQNASGFAHESMDWPVLDDGRTPGTAGSGHDIDVSHGIGPLTDAADMGAHSHHSSTTANFASPASSTDPGGHILQDFLASVAPPILAPVEIGPRWTSTKELFASLAGASDMVRCAILAFFALQSSNSDEQVRHKHKTLFGKASRHLTTFMSLARSDRDEAAGQLHYALATIFFLSYAALLTSRVEEAQSLLREATDLVRIFAAKDLTLLQKRLVSWIRLVDGRCSSAGGDGAFLAETDGEDYAPEAHQKPLLNEPGTDRLLLNVDSQIQEVLFDILHSPGLVFYQRVQSIMARVSNIDPWHRSRGTVADETEVMAIADGIHKSLIALERQRPALTDFAIAGTLSSNHIAKDIADALVRSYRIYWANYEAAYIHLHRVAHKHLPATPQVLRARTTIKDIARAFDQSEQSMPVNYIWPLLMACCEEDNPEDRRWMITTIRNMHSVASNARPIADVLEEVHRRQDLSKTRMDVRQVSIDLFNVSFAVV